MRAAKFFTFGALLLSAIGLCAQQKSYDWVAQPPDSFRIGPGFQRGIAVYNPHGWEALHVRLDIDSQQPVSVGVVRLEDWNHAVRNPEDLAHLDYACLTQGVTHIIFSCNFYPGYTSRVVVLRDNRSTDRPVISGAAAPIARFVNEGVANDVRVTPYRWECVSHCDLPDPPQFSWVELRREKFEIASAFKSYGPFTTDRDSETMRIRVKSPIPLTVAVVSSEIAGELNAHPDQAPELLARGACKHYGVESSTFDYVLQKTDGPMQVVLLPETQSKKKKVEIIISAVQCVANCPSR